MEEGLEKLIVTFILTNQSSKIKKISKQELRKFYEPHTIYRIFMFKLLVKKLGFNKETSPLAHILQWK